MTLPYTDKKGLTEDPFFRDEQMQERASTENDRYFIVQAERGKDESFEHFIDSRTQIFEDYISDSKLPTNRANRMIEYLTAIKNQLRFYHKYSVSIQNKIYISSQLQSEVKDTENLYFRLLEIQPRQGGYQKTYLMVDKSNGLYKIGKSIDPQKRLKNITNPNLELLLWVDFDCESQLHDILKDSSVGREFFRLSSYDIRLISDWFRQNRNANKQIVLL